MQAVGFQARPLLIMLELLTNILSTLDFPLNAVNDVIYSQQPLSETIFLSFFNQSSISLFVIPFHHLHLHQETSSQFVGPDLTYPAQQLLCFLECPPDKKKGLHWLCNHSKNECGFEALSA